VKKKAIVIGAGFAGLSSAAYLAKAGYDVTLLEKLNEVGGRARLHKEQGYVFDMGPSWYWMPEVFEQFFADFGHKTSDFYKLIQLDPPYRVYFGENDFVDIPANHAAQEALFESIEPGAGMKLRAFLKDAAFKYETGMGKFVHKPGLSLMEFADLNILKALFKLDLFSSISTEIKKKFTHPRIIQLLEFPVLFLGAKPSNTPALYSLMNYADLSLGTWYPMGGMYSVAKGMADVAIERGAQIRLEETVSKINVENGKVTSVSTHKGTYPCDVLVAGADYHHVDRMLLKNEHSNYSENYWDKRVMAPSSILFYLGINKKLEKLLHHNLIFDELFDKHAEEIYDNPQWPTRPLLYVSCATKNDPDAAPVNGDALVVLIPVAVGLEDNEAIREKYFNYAMDKLEKLTGESIREHIVVKRSYAHNDFIGDYNSFKGNAYGLANTLMQTAILKPSLKNKKLKNMYYAGQLTVPGPGVPPTIISGKVVSKQIELDQG
jgi:phytoene desaturase